MTTVNCKFKARGKDTRLKVDLEGWDKSNCGYWSMPKPSILVKTRTYLKVKFEGCRENLQVQPRVVITNWGNPVDFSCH